MLMTAIIFLVVLSVLVFVHELGHFWMAKKTGMTVEEFGFGFPPRLFGIRRGGTLFSVNAIPLGGFVKIKGEGGEHQDEEDSFSAHPARHRFAVLIAGVAMNIVLAIVLLSIGFFVGLPSSLEGLPPSARVRDEATRIGMVLADSSAERAGIRAGDTLVEIDGKKFATVDEAYDYIRASTTEMNVSLVRGEAALAVRVVREDVAGQENPIIGVELLRTGLVSYGFFEAIGRGITATADLTIEVVRSFVALIRSLVVSGRLDADLSGPVGIAVMTGEVAKLGLSYLIQFAALLSINLAVINVLPFPALDGGRILFLLIEKIRNRRVSAQVEAAMHNLGFLALLVLVVFVTYQDMQKFGSGVFRAIFSS